MFASVSESKASYKRLTPRKTHFSVYCILESIMGYDNAILSVENKDVIFIKPSKPTPTTILSLSSIDNVPESNFFTQSLHVYQFPNHKKPSPKLDPAKVIKEALSKALFYYYPLAGKLVRHADGKFRIHCTSEGVPFIEAFCNCNLSCVGYLDGNDVETAKHFMVDSPSQDEFGDQCPLFFKVTKFLCGGFTLVVGLSHAVCDGIGASQFLGALAELASGKTSPSVKPVWERERLVGTITSHPIQYPMDSACVAVSPFLPTTDFSHECSKVDSESIARLKMSLMKESDSEDYDEKKRFTTFETLAAYIWRSRARALKLSYDGQTMLAVVVSVRPQWLKEPLPPGYYGNTIVEAYITLTVRELNERPLLEVVELIRDGIKASLNSDYVRHSIDSMETPKSVKFNCETGAIMFLTDWRHLGLLEKVDFGWKEPVNTMPAPCETFGKMGLCTILGPTTLDSSKSGGARVYVSLPSAAMPEFKEEMKALNHIQDA